MSKNYFRNLPCCISFDNQSDRDTRKSNDCINLLKQLLDKAEGMLTGMESLF